MAIPFKDSVAQLGFPILDECNIPEERSFALTPFSTCNWQSCYWTNWHKCTLIHTFSCSKTIIAPEFFLTLAYSKLCKLMLLPHIYTPWTSLGAVSSQYVHQLDALQRETAHFIWQFLHVLHTNCQWVEEKAFLLHFTFIIRYQLLLSTRIIPKSLTKHICLPFFERWTMILASDWKCQE